MTASGEMVLQVAFLLQKVDRSPLAHGSCKMPLAEWLLQQSITVCSSSGRLNRTSRGKTVSHVIGSLYSVSTCTLTWIVSLSLTCLLHLSLV